MTAQPHRHSRERSLLAAGLIAAALVYVGFAIVWDAPGGWLLIEVMGAAFFSALALSGARRHTWLLAVGWGLHAFWDFGLHFAGAGASFAPRWYVIVCAIIDVLLAMYVAYSIRRS